MTEYTPAILCGVIAGTITRLLMLRTDTRQYPTRLHGKIIHIAMGLIVRFRSNCDSVCFEKRFLCNYISYVSGDAIS